MKQQHSLLISNKSFESGKAVTSQNCVHDGIKCRLNSGNTCYLSVQSILSFAPLYKNLKIKILKTIILLVVL
jgi:hypothetical protein